MKTANHHSLPYFPYTVFPAQRVAQEQQESLSANVLQLQKEFGRVEAELKYEKFKREMLDRELQDAKKAPPPPTTARPKTPSDAFRREQERRLGNILDICSSAHKPVGVVHSLLPTQNGMTYCMIPRSSDSFWLQIYRYIHHDYRQINIQSPMEISWKEAHNRPFSRTKKVSWLRLKDAEKQQILKSRIFFAVQDPFKRLWETYVDHFRLPQKWSSTGAKIEAKRVQNSPVRQAKSLVKNCGMDVTFQEFILFALKSYESDYDPYYRLCDPCQLKPTYIIREETKVEDTRFVLQHFNLAWVVSSPNFTQDEYLRYINNTVTEAVSLFKDAHKTKCASGGDLGKRLWSALEVMGMIPEGTTSAPYIDDQTKSASVIKIATNLFFAAEGHGVDRTAQKRKHMVQAFQSLSQESLEAIKEKYGPDFRLFDYERSPRDFNIPSH
ncbi:carbohydrate sulfotransferase [Plakobranchus ocellatus]|uniref:Carbohydrate sulfotransferase n=1 Tax=Plakobranchus ocellatus TaxID=259542 RepID=A0AAV3ZX04_9GAST|nr:carbohydrate sulfotransferase [Plakobranchus ocellatus]